MVRTLLTLTVLRLLRRNRGNPLPVPQGPLPETPVVPAPVARYNCCGAPVSGNQHTTRCPWWNDSDPYGEDYGANSIFGMG